MPTVVVKREPKSEGIATPRKKRPKELAVITECCTGCAGSPACVPYCPVADCMYWIPDEDHAPFGRIEALKGRQRAAEFTVKNSVDSILRLYVALVKR